jgi:hypothetical protein
VLGDACDVVARGCEEVTLPGAESVRVAIEPITPEAACSPELCVAGECMRLDAGPPDAGVPDVGGPGDGGPVDGGGADVPAVDAGMGDECTTSDECPCAADTCDGGWCRPARVASVIEAGARHVCAVSGGQLWCWGESAIGELGAGAYDSFAWDPERIGAASDWTEVSILGQHTCGTHGGTVACWGSNYARQIGVSSAPPDQNVEEPRDLPGIAATRTAVGMAHSLVIDDATGVVTAWGANSHHEAGGDDAPEDPLTPTAIPRTWLDVSGGQHFSCGITTEHELLCWGGDFNQILGAGACSTDCGPTPVGGPTAEWAGIEAGIHHACAWDVDGALYCWGSPAGGRLGVGSPAPTGSVGTPSRVAGIDAARASVSRHTCVVDRSGALWCFGPNESGQIGDGTTEDALDPTRIGEAGWTDVTTADQDGDGVGPQMGYSCGIHLGRVFCWGAGERHVLGQGMDDADADHAVPMRACLE